MKNNQLLKVNPKNTLRNTNNDYDLIQSPFSNFHSRIDKFFNELMNDFFDQNTLTNFDSFYSDSNYIPKISMNTHETKYEIIAELAGFDKNDISIEINNNMISITGKKSQDNNHENNQLFFERSFSIPSDVIEENISADIVQGLLEITLPREHKPAGRQIKIGK